MYLPSADFSGWLQLKGKSRKAYFHVYKISFFLNLDLWGLPGATGTVKLNVQMTVINSTHKIVHIRETLFWNRIGPVSQILRCIFQCGSATGNKEFDANAQHYNHIWYLCNEVWCNPYTTSYHFSIKSSCFALIRAKYINGCPLLNKYTEMRQKSTRSFPHCVYDRPLYIVCPDVLSTVRETSWGIWVGLIESDKVLVIFLLIDWFICIWSAKSTLVQLIKYKWYSYKNPSLHSRTSNLLL
jgi:hypothetical protein